MNASDQEGANGFTLKDLKGLQNLLYCRDYSFALFGSLNLQHSEVLSKIRMNTMNCLSNKIKKHKKTTTAYP